MSESNASQNGNGLYHRMGNLFSGKPKALLAFTFIFVGWVVLIDQSLKSWAQSLVQPVYWGWIKFYPYGNSGILGGYLSEMDPWIVRIFFSVLFGFLLVGVSLGLYLLKHKNTPLLKVGLVVYVSGVLGNVWDRMSTGTVVDYAAVWIPFVGGMAFNFSDLVVALGFIMIATALFKESDRIWYSGEKRQGYWLEPRFQRGFGFWLILLGFSHFFVIALYSFVYLKVFIGGSSEASLSSERIIRDYLAGLMVIEVLAMALTFAASVVFSHRMIGPILSLEQHVLRRRTRQKETDAFRVRRSDYFKEHLESIARNSLDPGRPTHQNPVE